MKISVVIPTYNSAATIKATLDSVLQQTVQPDEILVLDDGSTDNTVSLLDSYKPRIAVLQQENKGVAHARNRLCQRAGGDMIAFLDHDDLWHRDYLGKQCKLLERFPNAVASFTGHVNFRGHGGYAWGEIPFSTNNDVEMIEPLIFFRRYNETTGLFASMSYCCIPKKVLNTMGNEPFRISGVDDSYLCNVLSLLGPVAYASVPLVAYRITDEAQSNNRLKAISLWVEVFQILEDRFQVAADARLRKAFTLAFATKRRQHAKILMGVGRTSEARTQISRSLSNNSNPVSLAKSFGLLLSTYMPTPFQPRWPTSHRE